jgi:3-hydroxy-9,10-secoandrosta-1,3,5(10)-triene-9,17-dione monooxygenase reductase component
MVCFLVALLCTSWPEIRYSRGVSVLSHDHEHLCRAFAVSGADKFAKTRWTLASVLGSPRIFGTHACVDIEVEREVPLGDRIRVVGQVIALSWACSKSPLVFCQGGHHQLMVADAAT